MMENSPAIIHKGELMLSHSCTLHKVIASTIENMSTIHSKKIFQILSFTWTYSELVLVMSLSTSQVRAEAKACGYKGAGGAGGSTARERRDAENFGCAMHLLEMERKEKTELQEKLRSVEKERDIAKETTLKVERMLFQERKDTSRLRDQVAELRRELSLRQDRHKLELQKAALAPAALTSQLEQMTTNWQWEKNRRQHLAGQMEELQHKSGLAEGELKGQLERAKHQMECQELKWREKVETIARELARNREESKVKDEELAQLRQKEAKRKAKKMEKKGKKDRHTQFFQNTYLGRIIIVLLFFQFSKEKQVLNRAII